MDGNSVVVAKKGLGTRKIRFGVEFRHLRIKTRKFIETLGMEESEPFLTYEAKRTHKNDLTYLL